MILHLVFFRWNDDVTDDDVTRLTSMLREMAQELPMLRSYECGANLRIRPSDVDYAVSAAVDDEGALDAYLDSEAHRRIYDALLGRMLRDRSAAQLRVPAGAGDRA